MLYSYIDPVAINLGFIDIRWYGIAYLLGFLWVLYMGKYSIDKKNITWIDKKQYENMLVNCMLAVLVGGRFGYILFYQFGLFIKEPWVLFKIWQGGMSFHGGLLGCFLFLLYYVRKNNLKFLNISDLIVVWVPLGLGLGRIANFINGELWGRATNSDWGMVFPWVDDQLRHPSQIYEFFFEGLVLSLIMFYCWKNLFKIGQSTGVFLFFYGFFRFVIEFFRSPDQQIGFLFNINLTLGQLLSVPMIIGGILLIRKSRGHCYNENIYN